METNHESRQVDENRSAPINCRNGGRWAELFPRLRKSPPEEEECPPGVTNAGCCQLEVDAAIEVFNSFRDTLGAAARELVLDYIEPRTAGGEDSPKGESCARLQRDGGFESCEATAEVYTREVEYVLAPLWIQLIKKSIEANGRVRLEADLGALLLFVPPEQATEFDLLLERLGLPREALDRVIKQSVSVLTQGKVELSLPLGVSLTRRGGVWFGSPREV